MQMIWYCCVYAPRLSTVHKEWSNVPHPCCALLELFHPGSWLFLPFGRGAIPAFPVLWHGSYYAATRIVAVLMLQECFAGCPLLKAALATSIIHILGHAIIIVVT